MVAVHLLVKGALAFLASSATAATSPQKIADGIKQMAQKSEELQGPAQNITSLNAPLIVLQQGPFRDLVGGYTEIIRTGKDIIEDLSDDFGTVTGSDADKLYDAFHEFAEASKKLHEILISKAGILKKVPIISQPVTTVMLLHEAVANSIGLLLVQTCPPRAADLTAVAEWLDATLQECVAKYNSIAV